MQTAARSFGFPFDFLSTTNHTFKVIMSSLTNETVFKMDEQTLRCLASLPILVGFCLTIYMQKMGAHKSLQVWRALQVYDSQRPAKKGFTGLKKVTKVAKFFHYCSLLLPMTIYYLVSVPVDQILHLPFLVKLRSSMPFVSIAILGFLGSTRFGARWIVPYEIVYRNIQTDKKTKLVKAAWFAILGTQIEKKVFAARVIFGLSVLVPICLAFYCATYASSIFVLLSITILTVYQSHHSMGLPIESKKFSIPFELRQIALQVATLCFFASMVVGVRYGFEVYIFEEGNEKMEVEWENMKRGTHLHVVAQMICFFYVALWSIIMRSPASLLGLAYRYDASRSETELNLVNDQEKRLAILESRKIAKQNQNLFKIQKHPFDNLGRTPILLKARDLQINPLPSDHFPTFQTGIAVMIAIQAISLAMTWTILPSWFNVPFFIKTPEQASVYVFAFSFNYPVFIDYLLLPPFMLISAGLTARKNGGTFLAGVKRLWAYEETWSADYEQAPIDNEMDVEDLVKPNDDEDGECGEVEKLLLYEDYDDLNQVLQA